MDFPRVRHTATRLPDGKVLVAGGGYSTEGYHWASSELYDPDLGTWSPAASLNQGRFSHTATLLNDGRVLVVGGIYLNALASAELYGSLRSNPSSFLFLLLD
ncbi:MAG: hypothetical protein FJ121_07780 [Deltaproteobacteria bacterium]|nr:hypothetical protein [Deltaproteobacteria bacterium]